VGVHFVEKVEAKKTTTKQANAMAGERSSNNTIDPHL